MSGIICCTCSILAISILQFALIRLRNDLNKVQEKSESQQNRDLRWILLPGRRRFRLQLQWAWGRNITEVKIHGNQLLEKIDQGDLVKKQICFKPLIHYFHEQFMESFSSTNYSQLDDDRAWSSQEWKTEIKTYERSGRPDKTSWRMERKIRPDHEEILLDGTAQSVRYGETLRDRSGRPDNISSQEVANFQNFIMWNDGTELELSVESRSFVNRVSDQVRKRQKISNVAEDGEQEMEKSILWFGNVYGLDNGISSIHGKELPEQLSIHCESRRRHIETNVRHICKICVWTKRDLRIGINWFGESFMEISVINWWWKNHQSSAHESLRLFRFCTIPAETNSNDFGWVWN